MFTIATFPPVENSEQLTDIFYRLCWYISPGLGNVSQVSIPSLVNDLKVGVLPEGFDSTIREHSEEFAKKVAVENYSQAQLNQLVESVDLLIILDNSDKDALLLGSSVASLRKGKKTIQYILEVKGADSNILNLLSSLNDFSVLEDLFKTRLKAIDRTHFKSKGYILGTGPSLSSMMDVDVSDGTVVVCNSAVKNRDLLAHLRPKIIVAADPIFHSGCSAYAEEFRECLVEALREYGCYFFVPIRDYYIYNFYLPKDCRDKIIPVPFYFKGADVNFDFDRIPGVTITANILTLLLLPIGAYFFEKLCLAGCDGRALGESSYYWGHDPSAQFGNKMQDAREKHPGFFNTDFNEYYIKHCDVLDRWITELERKGKTVESIAPSYIPVLGERLVQGVERYNDFYYQEIREAIQARRSIKKWAKVNGEPSADLTQTVHSILSANCPKYTEGGDVSNGGEKLPRVLVLSSTAIGSRCATGTIKERLFSSWDDSQFMQVYTTQDPTHRKKNVFRFSQKDGGGEKLLRRCLEFAPDVIYYRPVASYEEYHKFAQEVIDRLDVPLVTHVMDDWPEELAFKDPEAYSRIVPSFEKILQRSVVRLSICEKMSQVYSERYGGEFLPIANALFPPVELPQLPSLCRKNRKSFVIRYSGALADNMTLASVNDVAKAVDELAGKFDVQFLINTMDWCFDSAKAIASMYRGVSVSRLVSDEEYKANLEAADLLVIAYNFDEDSLRYTHLSLANKLPEYMASCTPILAYGPRECATIEYISDSDFGVCVVERNHEQLVEAIEQLICDSVMADKYAQKAFRQLAERHNANRVLSEFEGHLRFAAALGTKKGGAFDPGLVGRFSRYDAVGVEEVHIVHKLLAGKTEGVMVDVGAHYGSSSRPFVGLGWKIFAFEPDPNNRKHFIKSLGNKPNVVIDSRAISNTSGEEVSFYTSPESTGVSGLSAFTDKHSELCKVTTVTLADYCKEQDIVSIDFLKIDTEGFEKMILDGVPWDKIIPEVILCEFEDAKSVPLGYSYHDLATYLLDKGYHVYVSEWHPILRYGIQHDWHRFVSYPCELSDSSSWGNLLAFREQPNEKELRTVVNKLIVKRSIGKKVTNEPQKKVNSSPVKKVTNEPQKKVNSSPVKKVTSEQHKKENASSTLQPIAFPHVGWGYGRHAAHQNKALQHIAERIPALNSILKLLMYSGDLFKRTLVGYTGAVIGLAVVMFALGWNVPDFSWLFYALSVAVLGGLGLVYASSYLNTFVGEFVAKRDAMRDGQLRELVSQVNQRLDAVNARMSQPVFSPVIPEEFDNLRERMTKLEQMFTAVESSLVEARGDAKKTTGEVQALSIGVQKVSEEIQAISGEVQKLFREVQTLQSLASVATDLSGLQQDNVSRFETLDSFARQNANAMETLENATSRLKRNVERVQDQCDQLDGKLSDAVGQLTLLDALEKKVKSPAIADLYTQMNRALTMDDANVIISEWGPVLGQQLSVNSISHLAQRVLQTEKNALGRFASNINDLIGRILVARSVVGPELQVLEIGTLFGISTAAIYDACRLKFDSIKLTVIDPLDGYYGKEEDPYSGVPVVQEVLERNFEILDIPRDDYRIVKEFSSTKAALKAVHGELYDLMIIDGDHSYEGVSSDVANYTPMLKPGGIMVVDDYRNPSWESVTLYVDEVMKKDKRFTVLVEGWHTIAFVYNPL